jgi:hypothetical protein
MNIQIVQDYIFYAMMIAMVCFTITTGILYVAVKRKDYTPVGVHVKSKWSINLDVKIFSDLRKAWVLMGKTKMIPLINQVSIYTLIIGWLSIIVSIFAEVY